MLTAYVDRVCKRNGFLDPVMRNTGRGREPCRMDNRYRIRICIVSSTVVLDLGGVGQLRGAVLVPVIRVLEGVGTTCVRNCIPYPHKLSL